MKSKEKSSLHKFHL